MNRTSATDTRVCSDAPDKKVICDSLNDLQLQIPTIPEDITANMLINLNEQTYRRWFEMHRGTYIVLDHTVLRPDLWVPSLNLLVPNDGGSHNKEKKMKIDNYQDEIYWRHGIFPLHVDSERLVDPDYMSWVCKDLMHYLKSSPSEKLRRSIRNEIYNGRKWLMSLDLSNPRNDHDEELREIQDQIRRCNSSNAGRIHNEVKDWTYPHWGGTKRIVRPSRKGGCHV